MGKQNIPVNKWVLDKSGIVRRLERDSSGLMVVVGDSKKLEIPNMRLLVRPGLAVYDVAIDYRSNSQFFFVANENDELDPAYLSLVSSESGGLNYLRNVGKLLEYPWFSLLDSAFVFDRLYRGLTNAPIYARRPKIDSHPFSGK